LRHNLCSTGPIISLFSLDRYHFIATAVLVRFLYEIIGSKCETTLCIIDLLYELICLRAGELLQALLLQYLYTVRSEHKLMKQLDGLPVDTLVTRATGTAEVEAAEAMVADVPGDLGGDKGSSHYSSIRRN
jgi:hypothetical protein